MDIIQDVLIYQTQMMRNSSLGPYVPADFSPPEYIVVVNALFYASLGLMLLAAFIAMLIKSWVRKFDHGLGGMSLPEQRAKTREFRYLGMEHWKLPEMVAILPLLIQLSLLLFAIGLVHFLFYVSKPSFGVAMSIFGVGVVYYAVTTSISVFVTSSPFHSPLSRTLGKVYQHVHAYFCPGVDGFLSPGMDTTPTTVLGRLRRRIQIFLQKSSPYLEKDFEEPVAASTMDGIQLSTAASALQRIHECVPNSPHSESSQWSVWQVAGGPTLRVPPKFSLPSWILDKATDEEYFTRLPPAALAAFVVVSLRVRPIQNLERLTTIKVFLQRADNSKNPWARAVVAAFDRVCYDEFWYTHRNKRDIVQNGTKVLISMIKKKELDGDESLWLLNMLSELHSDGWLQLEEPCCTIEICLAILLDQAPKWDYQTVPDLALLEATLTLTAISCTQDRTYQLETLANSRQHPWLLLNLRSPELISRLLSTPPRCHKQLISILFLVSYALIWRRSEALALQYFGIITAKGNFPLYTDALTTVAPVMGGIGLTTMGMMLIEPRRVDLAPIQHGYIRFKWRNSQEQLLVDYDRRLGANQRPDPNFLAILLLPLKQLSSNRINQLRTLDKYLRNPWLRLVARVVARVDILDEPGVDIRLFGDHRVHNMIAALSLLRYEEGEVTQYSESYLLASFLGSQERIISSLALGHYMKTVVFYYNPSAPSRYFSGAVHAVFNHCLPDHLLQMGWTILETFVDKFGTLSVEWRRTFTEAFFTLSRQPVPRPRGGKWENTPESELKRVLTWEYFHEREQEPEFTDSDFSGLDWMAMAWSLHLSQRSRTVEVSAQRKAQAQDLGVPVVNEEFVLGALCKLVDAAPYHQIIPIIPKLREFVQWFNGNERLESRRMVFAQIEEVVRRHQKFHKFHCMWYF